MPITSSFGYNTPQSTSTSSPYFPTRPQSPFVTCRPWRQLTDLSSFTLASSFSETLIRFKRNLFYFRMNYTIIALIILFLSLIFHPISLIVFIIVSIAWYFLYFSREDPLMFFNRTIDDRVVMVTLGVVTVVAVGLTGVWLNVLVSLVIAAVVVCLHAVFRGTNDLYCNEQEAADDGLVSVVGSPMRPVGYSRV